MRQKYCKSVGVILDAIFAVIAANGANIVHKVVFFRYSIPIKSAAWSPS